MKSPATISLNDLAKLAEDAARKAGREARDAGIVVAAIDVPAKAKKPTSARKKLVEKRA